MSVRAFHPLKLYPELKLVGSHFEVIRTEILAVRSSMIPITDPRAARQTWHVLPLLPEREDRDAIPHVTARANCRLVPKSAELLASISTLKAYSFSTLRPGGHIRLHRHRTPYVTATLCLQDGGNSYIVVDGKRRQYRDGALLVFDYTLEHEVFNYGPAERIVLLMLLDNRMTERPLGSGDEPRESDWKEAQGIPTNRLIPPPRGPT